MRLQRSRGSDQNLAERHEYFAQSALKASSSIEMSVEKRRLKNADYAKSAPIMNNRNSIFDCVLRFRLCIVVAVIYVRVPPSRIYDIGRTFMAAVMKFTRTPTDVPRRLTRKSMLRTLPHQL
jgi:hypothetical protein